MGEEARKVVLEPDTMDLDGGFEEERAGNGEDDEEEDASVRSRWFLADSR